MGFVLGESRGSKPCVFPCKVAPASDERYLVCAAGGGLGSAKAWSSPHFNGCFDMFCLFLHIAVTWCFGIFACKTHFNGCMIVVVFCSPVRREMRVWNLMLQNALRWLHGCCMGFVLGESRGRKPCVFPCKVVAAGDERYLVCAAGGGLGSAKAGSRPDCNGCFDVLCLFLHIAVT